VMDGNEVRRKGEEDMEKEEKELEEETVRIEDGDLIEKTPSKKNL
jgi:hypothetical protein